jgi:protein O-mannosyl-transferase
MKASDRSAAGNRAFLYWGVVGFLLLGIAVVYGQTLGFGFLDYDDPLFVVDCRQVRAGLTRSSIAWAFTNGPLGEWYPLSMMSHMLDCQLFGLSPGWHHLTNLVLHAATVIGLFAVLRRMTGELWPSAFVAAVLTVHPQHVESVAWISERRDVLSGLFFVLTLGAYLGYVRRGRTASRYLLVALMLGLGLMSKAMLVTVPALLLLMDYWPLGRFGQASDLPQNTVAWQRQDFWRLAIEKLPLLAIALADCAMTLATHAKDPKGTSIPWSDRASNAVVSLATYLFQFFYPADLAIFYPQPVGGHPVSEVAGAAAVLVAVSTAAVLGRRRCPYAFVGWCWFVGMMVPVLGLINISDHAMADRYMYLPSIGLSIALAWGAARLGARLGASRLLLGACAALAIGALASQALRQTSYWHNDVELWQHSLATTEGNAEAEGALGFALAKADRLDDAVRHYMQAARWGVDVALLNNLALVVSRQGKLDEAATLLRRAQEISPSYAPIEDNLGFVLEQQGEFEKATERYLRAIELDPFFTSPELRLANLLLRQGKVDEAIAHLKQAIALDPMNPAAHTGLAVALAEHGQIADAMAECRRALELSPDDETAGRVLDKLLQAETQPPAR